MYPKPYSVYLRGKLESLVLRFCMGVVGEEALQTENQESTGCSSLDLSIPKLGHPQTTPSKNRKTHLLP